MKAGEGSDFMAFAAKRRQATQHPDVAGAPKLSQHLRALQSHEPPDPGVSSHSDLTPWLRAAAVLACFHPLLLRAEAGARPLPRSLRDAIIAQSDPMQSPPGQRALPLPLRRRLLGDLRARDAMIAQLAANAPVPDLPVQNGFAAILAGPAAVEAAIARQDLALLTGIVEALPWVDGILDALPLREDLLAVIARARLTRPLVDLVGTHFAGRQDVLQDMHRQVADPAAASKVLFLYGPGGVGKSTVLAKFALDLAASGSADMIVYLNFDRPSLRVEEPLTVLREIVVQLSAQLRRDDLKDLAQSIDAYILRFAANRNALETASDGGGGWDSMMGTVAGAINALPDNGPILVLVDTFERAQRHGASLVHEFWRMMTTLGRLTERLRFFAAGRVDAFGIFENRIRLGGLSRSAVAAMLTDICGAALPAPVVDEVMKLTGGKPLTVRLAGLLIRRTGLAALSDPHILAETLLRAQSEQAEAVLYNRLLGQIQDPELRAIARPGLLLRRITPGLIAQVLAPACNLTLKPGEENALFDRYAREVDLVEPGMAEWGEPMLTHRADVRIEILPELRDGDPVLLGAIDQAAIAYFAGKTGPMARAEEIYHRLWTDEPPGSIEARWIDGVGPHLLEVMDEVLPAQRAWLANRLRIDIPEAVRAEADQATWEDFAQRTATAMLNKGDTEMALAVLRERTARLPTSPLYLLEADALSRLGRQAEMEAVIEAGLASAARAGPGARRQAAELRLMRALSRERRRKFLRAGEDTALALGIARDLADSDLTLRALVGLLRLHRKARRLPGPPPADLAAEANAILDRQGDASLSPKPALMRSLAAELGPLRPGLLLEAHRKTGHTMLATPEPAATEVVTRALDDLSQPALSAVADVVRRVKAEMGQGFRNSISELVSVASERGKLREVAGPLARMMAAETDQLLGAFPPPSMLHRPRSWWP